MQFAKDGLGRRLAIAEDRMRLGNTNQTSLLALLSPFTIFAVGKIRPIRDCPKNNRIPALSTRTHPESRHLLPAEGWASAMW